MFNFNSNGIPGFEEFTRAATGGGGRQVHDEYYKTLGVDTNCSPIELKKAFRKLAIKHHPDKGGDEKQFKKIAEAYHVLSDSELREKYDKFGPQGVQNESGGFSPSDMPDILKEMFGMGSRRQKPRQHKPRPLLKKIDVSLYDIYHGKRVKLNVKRIRLSKDRKSALDPMKCGRECVSCRGAGSVMRSKRVMMGIMQQVQTPCSPCKGTGVVNLTGIFSFTDNAEIDVCIPRGLVEENTVIVHGEGNHSAGLQPGDVHVQLNITQNGMFIHKGDDLVIEQSINLRESLCGYTTCFQHFNGEYIRMESDGVIQNNSVKRLLNMGLPIYKSAGYGDLYVVYTLTYPELLKKENVSTLEKAFTGIFPRTNNIHTDAVLYSGIKSRFEDIGNTPHEERHEGVQCAQQ